MNLDSWLIDRLARELHTILAGARVQTFTTHATDVFLMCYRQRSHSTLRMTLDPAEPLLALVGRTPENEKAAGGWGASAAPLLRGCIIDAVQAVPNDRIVNVDLSSRSAFGVPALYRLTFELLPRKPNAFVLRPGAAQARWTIISAAKQGHGARDTAAGGSYEPPAPHRQRFAQAQFVALADAQEDIDDATLRRLLMDFDPACTPLLAAETVHRAAHMSGACTRADRLLTVWYQLRAEVSGRAQDVFSPIFVYGPEGDAQACHLVELTGFDSEQRLAESLSVVCARRFEAAQRHRLTLPLGTLRKRAEALHARAREEISSLRRIQEAASEADSLRKAGDAIYAHLSEVPQGASDFVTPDGQRIALDPELTPKQNAGEYFKRFKKLRSGSQHVRERLNTVSESERYLDQLVWEIDRALEEPDDRQVLIEEIKDALGVQSRKTKAPRRTRLKPTTVRLQGGLAFVGRSPKDNERITFELAGPNDYWFHTHGLPGAHVVLKLDDSASLPNNDQIRQAAELAAGQSRAADSTKVEVDFTQRKHVRKRGKGRTGQVWYRDFQTVIVTPKKINAAASEPSP